MLDDISVQLAYYLHRMCAVFVKLSFKFILPGGKGRGIIAWREGERDNCLEGRGGGNCLEGRR